MVERTERRLRGGAGRVPPHNVEAESSLLGALLLSPDAIAAVAEMGLGPEDFYKPAHQFIYDAVRTLISAGEPADAVTVADELRRAGVLEDIGGPGLLLDLQAATPAISNAGRYGRIVRDTALLRRLIGVAGEIAEIAYDEPDDVTKALDEAENRVFQLADHQVVDSTRPLSDLLGEAFDDLQAAYERGSALTGVATGYHDLDELLSGLQPDTLNIVGARPSMGKTAFALGAATHVAINGGLPVLFFSLEMGHKELTGRILSAEARVDSKKLRTGDLTENDWSKIGRAIGRLDAPLYLDDNPNVTVMEIRAKARRMKARHGGLGLIVVDYLQLMSGRLGRREPSGGGQRAEPRPQDPRPRAAGAHPRPLAALAEPGDPGRQAADALGPARVRLHRAGRRRRDVHLPRRGLQPGLARPRRGRGHRGQAPQRAHRHPPAGVPRAVHPVRQRRPQHLSRRRRPGAPRPSRLRPARRSGARGS